MYIVEVAGHPAGRIPPPRNILSPGHQLVGHHRGPPRGHFPESWIFWDVRPPKSRTFRHGSPGVISGSIVSHVIWDIAFLSFHFMALGGFSLLTERVDGIPNIYR